MNIHASVQKDADSALLPSLVRPNLSGALPVLARLVSDTQAEIFLEAEAIASAELQGDAGLHLCFTWKQDLDEETTIAAVLVALECFFAASETVDRLVLTLEETSFRLRNLPFVYRDGSGLAVSRSGFYQAPQMWLGHPQVNRTLAGLVDGPDGRDHPLRAPHPEGLVYQRFDPVAGVTVSFRAVDIDKDLDLFHRWMNDGRVAFFWELALPKEELRAYLEQLIAKPHTYPLIGAFNGQDAGYFETYWVREDRLGPFYDSGPWDRGWHGLIGERRHLGRVKTGAWLRGLAHYLFLDCPMTENIMGEPRVDNAKLLTYADALAYEKVKEFDFPHKRSALMRCCRDRFFSEVRL
ncbi:GNAT family N-acetyltransferase [Roseibium sp.]|uniref:GNAT family N-acetyltransferase n=1 Tax=Roseibium sp. TaxID=1936156 RepID=UPI003262DF71